MRAAQIIKYGGRDAVQTVSDASKPIVAAGQVLVEVQAAGVNPFDWNIRDGTHQKYIKLELPATLGGDVAGTVAEMGEGVTGFAVGQAVYGMANAAGGQGSFAEFTLVKANRLAAKPATIDFVTAAALPLAATSAYQALVDHIDLQVGQKIMIHGGSGGIGSFAIQIAKQLGAYVAASASSNDTKFVEALGADKVIDYQAQDFAKLLKDYDAVFDTVGGETNIKSYTILKPGGVLVSMVQPPDEALVAQYAVRYTHQSSKATTERLTKIAELVDTGKLKVTIDKIFSLDEADEALEYLKTAHPRGKVVIRIKA